MKMCKVCGKEEGIHKLRDGYVCNRCYNILPSELKGKKRNKRVSTKVFQDIEKPETDKWLRYKDKLSMCSDKIAMGGYEIHIKNIKRLSLVFHPEKEIRTRIVYGSLCLNIETRYAKFEEEIEKCEILYRIDGKEISYTYPEVLSRLVKDINISIKEKTYNIAKTILWIRKEQMNLKGKAEYEYKKREESKEADKVKEKIKWQETEHIREERKKEEERRREREKRSYTQGWNSSQNSSSSNANNSGTNSNTNNSYQRSNGSNSNSSNSNSSNNRSKANNNTNSNSNNTNNANNNNNNGNKYKNNSDFIKTKVDHEMAIMIFGIGSYYTAKELKHRRNELIKQYHPDAGGSTKMCARINEAYEILEKYAS